VSLFCIKKGLIFALTRKTWAKCTRYAGKTPYLPTYEDIQSFALSFMFSLTTKQAIAIIIFPSRLQ